MSQESSEGTVAVKTLYRGSETIPSDAIVLFDGKDMSGWTKRGSSDPVEWKVENGYMEVVPGTGSICTKELFADHQLHLEFWLPHMPEAKGQARANSGVYLQGRYEIQVLDSYELDSNEGDCGAIYNLARPLINACRPPEEWQTYDVFFRAPRFNRNYNPEGAKTKNARISVLHNGIWVHHDLEMPEPTGGEIDRNLATPGPLMLQEHGSKIRYRNVWARRLSE